MKCGGKVSEVERVVTLRFQKDNSTAMWTTLKRNKRHNKDTVEHF